MPFTNTGESEHVMAEMQNGNEETEHSKCQQMTVPLADALSDASGC